MNQPWQSNYHDHLCQCPGCRGLEQDEYEFQVKQQAGAIEISEADIAYVWNELQSVPSYVETQAACFVASGLSQLVAEVMQARYEQIAEAHKIIDEGIARLSTPLVVWMEDDIRHTDDTPFCADADCPCHQDEALFEEFIARPIAEGRLKTWEAQALLWPER